MEHHFNVKIAQRYGIEEAIVLHHFFFWLNKNAANEKHFYDGLYWTRNSKKAYTVLFPYMNETKIFRVFKHLEDEGIIKKGRFNTNSLDKTNWYAITKFGILTLNENGYDTRLFTSIFQNDMFDNVKMNDGACQNEQSVIIKYNNNTDSNTDKEDKKHEIDKSISKKKDEKFEECWIAYRRKGSKKKALEYWNKLKDDEKSQVLRHVKAYVSAKELQYQKDFERYLRDKVFTTIVFNGNMVVYDPTKLDGSETAYIPDQNWLLSWNDVYKCYLYIGDFSDGKLFDGYDDDNRPDGATIMLNNARGTVVWSKEQKKWIKQ